MSYEKSMGVDPNVGGGGGGGLNIHGFLDNINQNANVGDGDRKIAADMLWWQSS